MKKLITVGKWTLSQTEDGRKVITHQGVSAAFMVRLNGTDLTIIPRNVKAIAGECISEYLSETQEVANLHTRYADTSRLAENTARP